MRAQVFEMSLQFTVELSPEWRQYNITSFKQFVTYRDLHTHLWQTWSTPACDHPNEFRPEIPVKLGPDAAALLGWSCTGEISRPYPERILVLSRGDARVRWLGIKGGFLGRLLQSEAKERRCCVQRTVVMNAR
jgi:hypothetical protein